MSDENLNQISRDAWDANAQVWDAKMGEEGNDFFRILQWPAISRLLEVDRWATHVVPHILDAACGNGLTSRKLAGLGAQVTAFDFSANLIELARARPGAERIHYQVLDATNEPALLALGERQFDAALSNMALFDMPEIDPLFRALARLLKPGGCFVFSIVHPAFNNSSSTHLMEEWDDGEIHTRFAVKIHRYMTPFTSFGLALRNQPKPQSYFNRPLQSYIQAGFHAGFVLDGFEERAFPAGHPQSVPLAWGGNFSEIPPVLVARMRLP